MTYDLNLRYRVIRCKKFKLLSINQISNIFKISKSTIYRWIKMSNIQPLKSRKSKLNSTVKLYIKNYVIRRVNFKYKLLIKNISRKFNITISKSYLYLLLINMNINRKMIYYKNIFTNKQKRKQQIRSFKNKIKNIPINDIISIDETSVDTHINHNYGWCLKGKTIKVLNKYQKIRYTVICAIDKTNILHFKIVKGSADGETFVSFIKELYTKITNKKYLLVDNARIHHYNKLVEYVNKNTNMEIIYNVPYSPEYNPIEFMFNEMKYYLKKNNINNKNILNNIKLSIKKLNKDNIKNYFNKSLIF